MDLYFPPHGKDKISRLRLEMTRVTHSPYDRVRPTVKPRASHVGLAGFSLGSIRFRPLRNESYARAAVPRPGDGGSFCFVEYFEGAIDLLIAHTDKMSTILGFVMLNHAYPR
jgi:hypothetical protein